MKSWGYCSAVVYLLSKHKGPSLNSTIGQKTHLNKAMLAKLNEGMITYLTVLVNLNHQLDKTEKHLGD